MSIASLRSCNGGRRERPLTMMVEMAFIPGQDRAQVPFTMEEQVIEAVAA